MWTWRWTNDSGTAQLFPSADRCDETRLVTLERLDAEAYSTPREARDASTLAAEPQRPVTLPIEFRLADLGKCRNDWPVDGLEVRRAAMARHPPSRPGSRSDQIVVPGRSSAGEAVQVASTIMSRGAMSDGEFTVRPSNASKVFRKGTPLLILIAVVTVAVGAGRPGAFVVAAAFVSVLLGLGLRLLRTRVVVTLTQIGTVGLLGRRAMRPLDDVSAVLNAYISESGREPTGPVHSERGRRSLFVLDRTGSTIARLKAPHWSDDDMDRLIRRLGIEPIGSTYPITTDEFTQKWPRAIPWWSRNSLVAGAVTVGGAAVGALLAVAVLRT